MKCKNWPKKKEKENEPRLSIYFRINIRKGDNSGLHCNWKDQSKEI